MKGGAGEKRKGYAGETIYTVQFKKKNQWRRTMLLAKGYAAVCSSLFFHYSFVIPSVLVDYLLIVYTIFLFFPPPDSSRSLLSIVTSPSKLVKFLLPRSRCECAVQPVLMEK